MGIGDDVEVIEFNPTIASPEKKEWYGAEVNSNCMIPALVTPGGQVMTESAAICFYLAQQFGKCLPTQEEMPSYYK